MGRPVAALVLALLLVGLPPLAAGAPAGEYRALWVDAYHDGFKTPEQVDRLLADARAAGANALFVQVRRRGDAYYQSGLEPWAADPDLAPGFDPLAYLLERAHGGSPRIEVHAWLAALPIWGPGDPPPDPGHLFHRHGPGASGPDDWLQRRDDGALWTGDAYYLDPGHPAAARHVAAVALDLVRRYPVDGLHLDRLRYAERGRWGYNPTSLARFLAATGRDDLPAWDDPEWAAWRRAQVTALLRRIAVGVWAVRPQVVVSAAVVAWGDPPGPDRPWEATEPYRQVFQDWRGWLEEGIVDLVVPMHYLREWADGEADRLAGWLAWERSLAHQRGLVVGLGAYLNAPAGTLAQIGRLRAASGDGWPLGLALYSYATPAGGPEPADWLRTLAGAAGPFADPAPPPALPWKLQPLGVLAVETPGLDGATVQVAGPVARAAVTDGGGLAAFVDLPPGEYQVSVEHRGRLAARGVGAPQAAQEPAWGPRVARVEPGRVVWLALAP